MPGPACQMQAASSMIAESMPHLALDKVHCLPGMVEPVEELHRRLPLAEEAVWPPCARGYCHGHVQEAVPTNLQGTV